MFKTPKRDKVFYKEDVEKVANKVLEVVERYGIIPPFNMEKLKQIANLYGIEVREESRGYNLNFLTKETAQKEDWEIEELFPFEGALYINKERGKVSIVINRDQPVVNPNRKNFTFAHELGHYFLHFRIQRLHEIPEDRLITFSRKVEIDQFEREANWFAVFLLMPERYVLRKWQELCEHYKDIDSKFIISKLAEFFGVSKLAMTYRIQELKNKGLIPDSW